MKKLIFLFLSAMICAGVNAQVIKPDLTRSPNGPNTIVDWNVKFKTMIIPHGSVLSLGGAQDSTGHLRLNVGTDTVLAAYIKGFGWLKMANKRDLVTLPDLSVYKLKSDSTANSGFVTHGFLNGHFSSSTYMDLLTNQRASGTKSFLDGAIFGDNTTSSYAVLNSAGLASLIGSAGNLLMTFQEFGFVSPSYTPVFGISPAYASGGPGYNIISGTVTHFTGPIIHEDTLRANLDPLAGKDVINLEYANSHYTSGGVTDTTALARKNGNSSITNLNYKINGTAGNGYIDIITQSVKPTGTSGHLKIYRDSVGSFSYMNGLYRRTFKVPRSIDRTIIYPYNNIVSTLADSTEVALSTTLQGVTDRGNSTTNPLITSNRIKKGSISSLTYFVTQGSSLTAGIGQADITSDTSRYSFKVSNAQGYIDANYGVSGRSTQDVTTNSLYTVSSAMVSPPTPSSFVFLDCFVNDAVKDTTQYLVSTFTTQLTATVNTLISKGYTKIIIGNPSYWSTTAFSNHGSIPYRHSIYATATQSVATATGVFFYDGYDAMRIANNTNPIYVFSDSLHMTKAGQTFFANNLIAFINSNSIAPAQTLTTVRDSTIGSINVYGNINAIGDINSAKRIFANDLYVSRQLTAVTPAFTSAALIGNNASSLSLLIGGQTGGGYAVNTNKFFNIMAPTYAAVPGTNQANSLSIMSGQQTATDNIIIYGKDNINLFGATRYSYYASTGPNNANTGVEIIRNNLTQNNFLNGIVAGVAVTTTITSGFIADIRGAIRTTSAPTITPFTTNGGLIYTNASGLTAQTAAGTSTMILHGGTVPAYSAVSLTADVTGILPIANGGHGIGTAPSINQIPIATSTTVYTPTTISGDVTNAAGVFTIGANKVTYAKMQTVTTNKILGSGSGTAVAEITLGTGLSFTGTTLNIGTVNRSHTIFTPTTGGTVTLAANQYNIINPAGALVALTVTLPSSPVNNDTVQIKFTQAVTTVTYSGGTVADGITSPIAGGYVIFTYDSGTTTWY